MRTATSSTAGGDVGEAAQFGDGVFGRDGLMGCCRVDRRAVGWKMWDLELEDS
jgi:hypothetical protein